MFRLLIAFMLLCAVSIPSAVAVTVTDITGRKTELSAPAKKIILGEGRFLAAIGILDRKNPTERVVGMLGEFKRFDPAGYAHYAAGFPQVEKIPLFGLTSEDSVSVEKIIALKPEVAIFGLSGHGPHARSKAVTDKMEAAGISIVYIDFRDNPIVNTPKSMKILGQVLGREKEAAEFIEFYRRELSRISTVLENAKFRKPEVFLETHVGLGSDCCRTISKAMLSKFIEFAGGRNIADEILPGVTGLLNLELLLARQPDVYIGTAIGSAATAAKSPRSIILGADATGNLAQASLKRALSRKGISDLRAVASGRAHAIWHHYYNSPLNIVAVHAFAKWFHPDLFGNLDPEETLRILYRDFQPVPLSGKYMISLDR